MKYTIFCEHMEIDQGLIRQQSVYLYFSIHSQGIPIWFWCQFNPHIKIFHEIYDFLQTYGYRSRINLPTIIFRLPLSFDSFLLNFDVNLILVLKFSNYSKYPIFLNTWISINSPTIISRLSLSFSFGIYIDFNGNLILTLKFSTKYIFCKHMDIDRGLIRQQSVYLYPLIHSQNISTWLWCQFNPRIKIFQSFEISNFS